MIGERLSGPTAFKLLDSLMAMYVDHVFGRVSGSGFFFCVPCHHLGDRLWCQLNVEFICTGSVFNARDAVVKVDVFVFAAYRLGLDSFP